MRFKYTREFVTAQVFFRRHSGSSGIVLLTMNFLTTIPPGFSRAGAGYETSGNDVKRRRSPSRLHLHQLIILRPEPQPLRLVDLELHGPGVEGGQDVVENLALYIYLADIAFLAIIRCALLVTLPESKSATTSLFRPGCPTPCLRYSVSNP